MDSSRLADAASRTSAPMPFHAARAGDRVPPSVCNSSCEAFPWCDSLLMRGKHLYWLSARDCDFERGGLGNNRFKHSVSIDRPQFGFVRAVNQEAPVRARHEVAEHCQLLLRAWA